MKVTGQSGVVHEFDMLIIQRTAANACRKANLDPVYSDVVAHAEAKFYSSSIPLPIGRGVIGLAIECDLFNKSVLVTNQNAYNIEKLIKHYGLEFRYLVSPGSKGEYWTMQFLKNILLSAP